MSNIQKFALAMTIVFVAAIISFGICIAIQDKNNRKEYERLTIQPSEPKYDTTLLYKNLESKIYVVKYKEHPTIYRIYFVEDANGYIVSITK